jgi:hypothetical protein
MKPLFSKVAIAFFIALAGCTKSTPVFQNPAYKPDAKIQNSFGLVANEPSTSAMNVDKARVSIAKSALEKEFLLHTNLIMPVPAAQFKGMQTRIVVLRQNENKVFMLEASKGLVAQKGIDPQLILAEFPVLSETSEAVTFDFNTGMSRIFGIRDWHTRDFKESSTAYPLAKIAFSYIERAGFSKNNVLEIHQVAQLEITGTQGTSFAPVEAIYYLSPYTPDTAFSPTKAPKDMRQMGFFEVKGLYTDASGTVNYASKHNLNKPVVYAMSANTPEKFKEAVRDGILYWNRAFGKEVLQVIEAPAEVKAPTSDYNVVQWVDWDSAGFAYADAQMDPRTGEILHQQIFLTSAFADIGKIRARAFLRESGAAKKTSEMGVGLNGFEPQELCDRSTLGIAEDHLQNTLLEEKDEAKLLKAAQDFVREVVAHEVGHTLGLRHNFAGSLAANYDVHQRDNLFKEYLATSAAKPDLVTTSSVMEYSAMPETMMNGDHIAKGMPAGEYDQKVIQSLYYGKEFARNEMPLFCTDSQIGMYLDCSQHDVGSSVVDWSHYSLHTQLQRLPYLLFETYIYAKTPLYGAEPTPLEEVGLDAKNYAQVLGATEQNFLQILSPKARLLKVDRMFPTVTSTNEEAIRSKFVESIAGDMAKHGNFDGFTLHSSLTTGQALEEKFEALLQNPELLRGIGMNGKPYEFSSEDVGLMRARAKEFFAAFSLELVKAEVKAFAGAKEEGAQEDTSVSEKFAANTLSESFAAFLEKRLNHYVFATLGEPLVLKRTSTTDWSVTGGGEAPVPGKQTTSTTLTLPKFMYPREVRKTAATFLAGSRADAADWAFSERVNAQKSYEALVSKSVGGPLPSDLKVMVDFPKAAVLWVLEAQEVKQSLEKN